MKLGYYYHLPAFEKDGRILMHSNQGMMLDELAKHHALTVLQHTPLAGEKANLNYTVENSSTEVVFIGRHSQSIARTLSYLFVSKKRVGRMMDRLDVLIIRGPSPLLPFLLNTRGRCRKALLLVGEYRMAIKVGPLLKQWAVDAYFAFYNFMEERAIRKQRPLVMVNSMALFEEYTARGHQPVLLKTTNLQKEAYWYREDRTIGETVRALYAGRIVEDKGLFELSDVLIGLNREGGRKYELHLAGFDPAGGKTLQRLEGLFREAGLGPMLIYHGNMAVDEHYYELFRTSSFFIIPSYNEGFPRVVWEAMANSLPVIATRVGSVPYFLEDRKHCLLIRPKQPREIEAAIRTLLSDEGLRRSMIRNGYELALDNNLERFALNLNRILADAGFSTASDSIK